MESNKWMYIRTSTEDQEPENQINDTETISGKDYILLQDKQSAWKDNKDRPDFERLKVLIKKAGGGDLYVWDWDRLFRNRKRLKEFFQFCAMHKCRVHSFRQDFFEAFYKIPAPFDEIMQELFLNLLGWLAEDESTKKSDRVMAARRKICPKCNKKNNADELYCEKCKTSLKNEKIISYKGKAWGRKNIPKQSINKVIQLKKDNPELSIREISKAVTYYDKHKNAKNISRSAVHKILQENTEESR